MKGGQSFSAYEADLFVRWLDTEDHTPEEAAAYDRWRAFVDTVQEYAS